MTVSSIFTRVSRNFHDSCTGSRRGSGTVGGATVLPAVSRNFGDGVVNLHKGVKEFS